jgi:hypothetical protein
VSQLRRQQDQLERASIDVLVVTFEEGESASRYVEETALPWPLLLDRDRELYAAYAMGRASRLDVWGPATWRAYAREIAAGARLRRSRSDLLQRGGDVLIDPDGVVVLHHVGNGPADRPPVERILAHARQRAPRDD